MIPSELETVAVTVVVVPLPTAVPTIVVVPPMEGVVRPGLVTAGVVTAGVVTVTPPGVVTVTTGSEPGSIMFSPVPQL